MTDVITEGKLFDICASENLELITTTSHRLDCILTKYLNYTDLNPLRIQLGLPICNKTEIATDFEDFTTIDESISSSQPSENIFSSQPVQNFIGTNLKSLLHHESPVPDCQQSSCYSCNCQFGYFVRKHHCRSCGNIFCDTCSSHYILPEKIPNVNIALSFTLSSSIAAASNTLSKITYGTSKQVRVCRKCYVELTDYTPFIKMIDKLQLSIPALIVCLNLNSKWKYTAISCLRKITSYLNTTNTLCLNNCIDDVDNMKKYLWKHLNLFDGHSIWYQVLIDNFGETMWPYLLQVHQHNSTSRKYSCLILGCHEKNCQLRLSIGQICVLKNFPLNSIIFNHHSPHLGSNHHSPDFSSDPRLNTNLDFRLSPRLDTNLDTRLSPRLDIRLDTRSSSIPACNLKSNFAVEHNLEPRLNHNSDISLNPNYNDQLIDSISIIFDPYYSRSLESLTDKNERNYIHDFSGDSISKFYEPYLPIIVTNLINSQLTPTLILIASSSLNNCIYIYWLLNIFNKQSLANILLMELIALRIYDKNIIQQHLIDTDKFLTYFRSGSLGSLSSSALLSSSASLSSAPSELTSNMVSLYLPFSFGSNFYQLRLSESKILSSATRPLLCPVSISLQSIAPISASLQLTSPSSISLQSIAPISASLQPTSPSSISLQSISQILEQSRCSVKSSVEPVILNCCSLLKSPLEISTGKKILIKKESVWKDYLVQCLAIIFSRLLGMKPLTYGILPITDNLGIIEIVPNAKTLNDVYHETEFGGSIARWLLHANGKEEILTNKNDNQNQSYNVEHFQPCNVEETVNHRKIRYEDNLAFYTLLSYLIGIGDRHLGNIMITENGEFFHIDYSYLFGNNPLSKKCYSEVLFTRDMLQATKNPSEFIEYCGKLFTKLRQKLNYYLPLYKLLAAELHNGTLKYQDDLVSNFLKDRLFLTDCEKIAEEKFCSRLRFNIKTLLERVPLMGNSSFKVIFNSHQ